MGAILNLRNAADALFAFALCSCIAPPTAGWSARPAAAPVAPASGTAAQVAVAAAAQPQGPRVPQPPVAWTDAPISPGEWSYRSDTSESAATFASLGRASFIIRCSAGRMSLIWPGDAASPIAFRTTSGRTQRPVVREASPVPAAVLHLTPTDPLLDDLVFSRGRFAVESANGQRLVMPAWPEAARVVEDCRRR